MVSSLAVPVSRALVSVTILNVEPGAYRAWVARLYTDILPSVEESAWSGLEAS